MAGIFLAFNSGSLTEKRTALFNTLVKAGLQVFPSDISFDKNKNNIDESLTSSQISLHLLGLEYGEQDVSGVSVEEFQLRKSLAHQEKNPGRRVLIWFPFSFTELIDEKQKEFISGIRNNIREGINFSNVDSPILLVDDIRISITPETKEKFDVKNTDVFLVHNQLDDNEANEVVDMLSDIVPVEKLNIIQDSDTDYSELCAQQMLKSKLAVVYFKESADWALPFVQQIWKKVGGASSHTPILLIGDENPETNMNKKFKAPKVVSLIVAGELVPLEIKVQYDKVLATTS
jgi:hypothetical protein